MVSYSFKVLFYVLISARLMVPLDADDDDCTADLKVRRNTSYKASLGQELRVECPVAFCNNLPPTICWYKVKEEHICLNDNNNNHMKTEWKRSNPSEGIFYLLFQSIIISDSGEYRCKGGGSRSHIIYIDVYDMGTNDPRTTITSDTRIHEDTNNVTNNQPVPERANTFLMSIYSTAGIGSFVVIVFIISIICMRGLKGKSRTESTEVQSSPRGNPTPAEEQTSVVYMVCQEGKLPGR
ncbi:B- and T-lymphocyte attenuator-like [Xiphophorus maculatus]|uniref:B- and T-lymphocyte attenuator-like n=1 Tax=Xiphophorus maculatus TaxID=8083 RepID=UPI000C6D375D|nr:B- and T-lymphocyte attenuator-like [Xiphophorus maculatus]